METVFVIANAPLPKADIDVDKVADEVETLSIPELTQNRQNDVLLNVVATQLLRANLNDEQGSQFQPNVVHRDFAVSPLQNRGRWTLEHEDYS